MRTKGLTVLALSGLLLCLALYPQGAAKAPGEPRADEGTAISLHFKGEGFSILPPKPGNSTEETKNCPGRNWGGRMYGTQIGEWTFLPTGDVKMQGAFKAELWADSDTGAKNAGFRLNFYEGDTIIQDLYSERVELSTPHKFLVSGSVTTTCKAGVQVKVGLVWLSDPNRGVGPSGSGTFLYGSMDHDSLISFTLASSPVTMNLTTIEKEKDALKVNARVNDSLGLDPASLTYKLVIQGPATVQPEHISAPTVAAGDNGTSISWLWSFRKSRAQSGMYTFTMTVYYSNSTYFSSSNQTQINIEVAQKVDTFKALTTGTNLYLLVGSVVIMIVVGLVVFRWVLRRRRKARLSEEMRLDPEGAQPSRKGAPVQTSEQ